MFFARRFVLGLSAVFLSTSANAIVNLEKLHLGSATPGFAGQVQAGVSGDSGNSNTFAFSAGTQLQWYREPQTRFLLMDYTFGESNGKANKNKGFVHARQIRQFRPATAWEGFAQIETNEFARLGFRGLLGGGLRFNVGEHSANRAAFFGLGGFYSREILKEKIGFSDAGAETIWRSNTYLLVKRQISAQTALASTTYLQPSFSNVADYRLLENAALQINMAKNLTFELSLDLSYDSRPPQTVKKADISYATAVAYHF